jgi:hypothetical protein
MRVVGYMATALVVGVVIGAVVVGANSTGDVKRYLRMRKM